MGSGDLPPADGGLRNELEQQGDEPLLPVEKKLIVGSLLLGLVLLAILLYVSNTWFTVAG